MNARQVEESILREVDQHVKRMVKGRDFDRTLDEVLGKEHGKRTHMRGSLEREREEVSKDIARLVAAVQKGLLPDDVVKPKMDALGQRLEAIEAERHKERFVDRSTTLTAGERKRLKAMAADFSARIRKAPLPVARDLLGAWAAEIVIDGRDVRRRSARLVLRRVPIDFSNSPSEAR